jgi:LEA14-like dessication related protein
MNLLFTKNFMKLFSFKTITLLFLFFINSTTVFASPKSPEFVRTKEWKISRLPSGNIVLTTKAVFYNPNKAKAKLKDITLNVFANDDFIGTVNQIEKIKIHGNSSFDIPLRLEFNLKDSKIDLFGSLLNLMSNNKFIVDIIGDIKMNIFCIPFKVRIAEQEEFSIKDFIN